jgi:purine-binding chemotaxis protein CheW
MSNTSKQLKDALASHRKWRDRIRETIETCKSESSIESLRRDDADEFGKWIYQTITPAEKASAHFSPALERHAKFHIEASQVLAMALKGQKEQATRALGLGSPFSLAATEFDSTLMAWYQECITAESTQSHTASRDKQKSIMEARARALTKVTETQTGEAMSLVVFSLAGETYGVAAEYVQEIQPLGDVTPVPCTPDFVVGLMNVRGSIYSVVDIRSFFGVTKKEITGTTKVLLAKAGGLEVGILADDVSEAKSLLLSEIKPPTLGNSTGKEEYVSGVTKDMLTVLNLDAFLRDDRIIVRGEV